MTSLELGAVFWTSEGVSEDTCHSQQAELVTAWSEKWAFQNKYFMISGMLLTCVILFLMVQYLMWAAEPTSWTRFHCVRVCVCEREGSLEVAFWNVGHLNYEDPLEVTVICNPAWVSNLLCLLWHCGGEASATKKHGAQEMKVHVLSLKINK